MSFLSHRSFRRSPTGLRGSSFPGRWAGRNTSRSSLRRFLPPTGGAEQWYTPSWFLFANLRFLLQACGVCLLHVLNKGEQSGCWGVAEAFLPAGYVSWAAPMWAGLTRQSREFLAAHATCPDVTQRGEEWTDSCDVVREVTSGYIL